MTDTFAAFFERATGLPPHAYQQRVVASGRLPELIEIPPGYGKTAAIGLGWLWLRVFHPQAAVRASTPRRLVYALPFRSITTQVGAEITRWLANLRIDDEVQLHVIMGGSTHRAKPWREQPEAVSIIVGTIDLLTSKGLMRAYGTPRNAFPMDAALVWNDAQVVVDEVQAARATTITMRQIDAFRRGKTVGGAGLTCMSATVPRDLIDTVDNPFPAVERIISLGDGDDVGELATRRAASKTVRGLDLAPGDARAIATAAQAEHRAGTLTLVIVNTVALACDIHAAILRLKPDAEVLLLHSRFRPGDRQRTLDTLTGASQPSAGRIVVSTQVVEAGMDLDAATLLTEVAPWPSLIQRSGRCNRAGRTPDATLYWLAAKSSPYDPLDLAATQAALTELEGREVTNEQLLELDIKTASPETLTLRRTDFEGLFDTMPDLSGNDLDVAPYIRDTDELDAQLCWLDWGGFQPPDDLRPLGPDERCRVPLGRVAELSRRVRVWRFDQLDRRWRAITPQSRARPGEVLIVAAKDGGYLPSRGFDAGSTSAVPPTDGAADDDGFPEGSGSADSMDTDPLSMSQPAWVPLDQHLTETEAEARRIVAELGLTADEANDVALAARVHDVGKAHPTWQTALCRLAAESDSPMVENGRPWAKSAAHGGRLRYPKEVERFRHELASVLLLDGPLSGLLSNARDPDLVRYLVLAHHGKLRVQVRDTKRSSGGSLLGLADGEVAAIPSVLGSDPTETTITLSRFTYGGDPDAGIPSWADTVADLLARYSMFRLAYLETLVRVADWRASALHDVQNAR